MKHDVKTFVFVDKVRKQKFGIRITNDVETISCRVTHKITQCCDLSILICSGKTCDLNFAGNRLLNNRTSSSFATKNRMISRGSWADVEKSAKASIQLAEGTFFLHLKRCFNDGSWRNEGRDNFVFLFLPRRILFFFLNENSQLIFYA